MTRENNVLNVMYIIVLLCTVNYVHCLRNGRLKGNDIKGKLLLAAQNSTSFADYSWFPRLVWDYFTSELTNPWAEYMKRFVTLKNHTMNPVKDVQFGRWGGKDDTCHLLDYYKEITAENEVKCSETLIAENNNTARKLEKTWADWVPPNKCRLYHSIPSCLLHKKGGYAFDLSGVVNFKKYDLPQCNKNSNKWKIMAQCGSDNFEKQYTCENNNWVNGTTKITQCLNTEKSVIIERAGDIKEPTETREEGQTIVDKETGVAEETGVTEETEESEESEKSEETEEAVKKGTEEAVDKGTEEAVDKEAEEAVDNETERVVQHVEEVVKESSEEVKEMVSNINQTITKIAENQKQAENGQNLFQNDQTHNIIEEEVKEVVQDIVKEVESEINDKVQDATGEMNRQKNRAKRDLNQAELDATEELLNQAKDIGSQLSKNLQLLNNGTLAENGTTSSAKRYALVFGAIDIASMLIIATFVL